MKTQSAYIASRDERRRMRHPRGHEMGPYEVGESCEGDLCIYTSDSTNRVGGDPIAVLVKEAGGHELPFEANAKLLAKAPEMLDLLQHMDDFFERYHGKIYKGGRFHERMKEIISEVAA